VGIESVNKGFLNSRKNILEVLVVPVRDFINVSVISSESVHPSFLSNLPEVTQE
jgi:hypothetical protein